MSVKNRTVEEKLARMASRAHGLVTRAGMLAAGITRDEIESRVRDGSLLRVYRGVYRVGHTAPSLESRYLAAVLACGPGALLSGRAAGHLLGLLKGTPPSPEVTARTERRIKGIGVRRSRETTELDQATYRGIPTTTVPRTLVDLASVLSLGALSRACHEAGVRYRTTPAMVAAILQRQPNSPGAANLRRVLFGDVRVSLSKLESKFLARLRAASIRLPDETNRIASARRVDCRYHDPPLTIELDSYTFHNTRHSWENDRRREREAYARGDQIRRYTYGDVFESPAAMLAELAAILPPS